MQSQKFLFCGQPELGIDKVHGRKILPNAYISCTWHFLKGPYSAVAPVNSGQSTTQSPAYTVSCPSPICPYANFPKALQ
jgi:hypothetical protein